MDDLFQDSLFLRIIRVFLSWILKVLIKTVNGKKTLYIMNEIQYTEHIETNQKNRSIVLCDLT